MIHGSRRWWLSSRDLANELHVMMTDVKKLIGVGGVAIVFVCAIGLGIGIVSMGKSPNPVPVAPQVQTALPREATSYAPSPGTIDMTRVLKASTRLREMEATHAEHFSSSIPVDTRLEIIRKRFIRDYLRPAVELQAMAHNVSLVFDSRGRDTNGTPVLLYSTDVTNLNELASSPGVIDLTEDVIRTLR